MRFALLLVLTTAALSAAPSMGLKPIWEENFDGKELDPKKWNSSGAVKLVDGKLSLEITSALGGKPGFWAGSAVNTNGKFDSMQGYFEASIRMLQTKGRWADFSVRNADMGKIPAAAMSFTTSGNDKIDTTLWFADETGSHNMTPKTSPVAMVNGASYKKFHTYGLQWTTKSYIFFVDGRKVQSMDRPSPKEPMHIAFGHNLPEGGLLKDFMNPAMGPEPLQVDWVKAYKIP
jgi:beta-glucanase (GH16 family)